MMTSSSALRRMVAIIGIAASVAPAYGQRNHEGAAQKNDDFQCQGIGIVRGPQGEVCFGMWTYMRYINQLGLDTSYVDAFGRTRFVKRQQNIENLKVTLTFKGWMYDPKLRYRFYVWTSNANQGQGAQTAVTGYLEYVLNRWFAIEAGTDALPTTRSTSGNFPNWLKVDHRTIADEFFRGSFTMGVTAYGALLEGLKYRVMLGNNLSQLGVDALQLDNQLNTIASALWWMPTTREYGPGEGFGDYESHRKVATILGVHFTQSREDKQSQPNPEDIENSQIRLSDGTNIFLADAFGTGGQVNRATYRMFAADGGLKYRGFSLDGTYYSRWIVNFSTTGSIPVSSLYDRGYDVQGSAMVMPRRLQLYAAHSKILGAYGHPWDLSGGFNVFPVRNRRFRLNGQVLYLNKSPVGYSSVPFPLGGKGFVYTLDTELVF